MKAPHRPLPAPTGAADRRALTTYLDARGLVWRETTNKEILILTPPRGLHGVTGVAVVFGDVAPPSMNNTPGWKTYWALTGKDAVAYTDGLYR